MADKYTFSRVGHLATLKRAFRNFEPDGWLDYALIPWWLARYLYALLWTALLRQPAWRLRMWLWRRGWRPYSGRDFRRWRGWIMRWLPSHGGRHVDSNPVICERCLWAGMVRWTYHTYQDDGTGEDVEPVDECPRCGKEI